MENDRSKFKNEFKNRLYQWVIELIKYLDKLSKDSLSDIMSRQLLRSGTSVLANYVEATSASSRKDFINFFTHSLKSANESVVWLELLRDTRHNSADRTKLLIAESKEISNILASSIITMKNKRTF